VDTLHTVLNRGMSLWDQALLPREEFGRRLNGVREGMKERGLDLVLVYGDSWRFGHLAFVSHFMPKNRGALAMIPLEGEPALIVQEPSRNNPFSKTLTWFDEVRSVGKFAQGVGAALEARGLKPRKVGLVAVREQLNIREWGELEKLLEGAELSGSSDLLVSLRLVKSTAELSLLKRTCRILSDALEVFAKEARPGIKEHEIFAALDREARRQGAEDFRFMVARSSTPEIGLRPAEQAALTKGESIPVLVAASYQRYWAELGQTFCLGQPSPELRKAHDTAVRVFGQLTERTRAGVSPAAVAGWLREVPSAAARESLAAYGVGNGVGLDLTEEPYLGKAGPGEIGPGMVLTLRACFTGRECGSALISRPHLVTETGLEPLVPPELNLVSVGG
jgi:Xaa-Pro aminopeptidase